MRIRTGMRRATTQMLNAATRRTGLSSRRSSLLSSVRSRRTGLSSRLDAMNASSPQSSRIARSNYEKLQKSADSLVNQAQLLAEKVDTGGKSIGTTAAGMVSDFNSTLKYLRQNSGVLNEYYRQSLKETAATNKKELEEIGISVSNDGSLTLNKEKLAEADEDKVRKMLGTDSDFIKRINAVASRAADNARANAESVSSQYNAAGGLASSYLSKYNFRG